MNRFLHLAVMTLLFIALIASAGTGQDLGAASENEKTRLSRDEIIKLMIQLGRLPVPEQDSKMDRIWRDPSGSQTPRSDFLFCAGLAYLGNHKAQAYLGNAFENGRGIVRDPYESYIWYSIALGNLIDDEDAKQKIQKGRDRVKMELVSVYPAPSDHELEEAVETQKHRMIKYLSEIRDTQP
jgi:hypothetical protein